MKNTLLSLLIFISFNCLAQTYRPILGKIEAESFDSKINVATETCQDTGGGQDMGGMVDNSSLTFRFEIFEAGYFTFKFRVANGSSDNASLQLLRASNLSVLSQVAVPAYRRHAGLDNDHNVRESVQRKANAPSFC
jgi:endoglucanase